MRGGLSHFRAGIMVARTKEVLDRAAATDRIAKWSSERHPAVYRQRHHIPTSLMVQYLKKYPQTIIGGYALGSRN